MALRRAGVDISVIALWLGHEDTRATQVYIHADLELKERAPPAPRRQTSRRAGTRPPTRSSPTSRACELCRARSTARAVLTSIPQTDRHNCLVAIMLVRRSGQGALPEAGRHPGRD
jgi:hypothetical protein